MKVLVIGDVNVITRHAETDHRFLARVELYDQHACIEIDPERRWHSCDCSTNVQDQPW